jgi:hypothetical protein
VLALNATSHLERVLQTLALVAQNFARCTAAVYIVIDLLPLGSRTLTHCDDGGQCCKRAKNMIQNSPNTLVVTMSAPVGAAPDNANEGCVGPQSDSAGKASACAGCPNQAACASGTAKAPDPAAGQVRFVIELICLHGKFFLEVTNGCLALCNINMLWPL